MAALFCDNGTLMITGRHPREAIATFSSILKLPCLAPPHAEAIHQVEGCVLAKQNLPLFVKYCGRGNTRVIPPLAGLYLFLLPSHHVCYTVYWSHMPH